ncbi:MULTISPECIES: MBL fold metallo-hydrolase [unclassified Brevundimonas]|uniref:MBL fold metallo-hydrolase n=1 Tax=unclassified Brevundimonas TaxID=2622653 RepID=UPI0025BC023F|nr:MULTISPECIES: MBL fold metallo-hydrolase [unclassified Brevundimonas]
MQFIKAFDFAYGRCDRISPLVERVIANNPGPFTFTGTGTYIVGRGDGAVAVIDPGPADEAHLDALLGAIGYRKVSHILVTHTHADHAPLSRPLSNACGKPPIYAAAPPERSGESVRLDEADDEAFSPDVIIRGGETIEGDGWTIEVMATPGHASNHMCFVLAEENGLLSGDHIMGWSTTIVAPPDGDMSDYMASLEAVMARDFHIVWPTHGAPITDVEPFLKGYHAHRMAREEQIIERLKAGDTTIERMVPVLYATVSQSLWPAASLSVLSHLIKLAREGRAVTDDENSLSGRWSLIG